MLTQGELDGGSSFQSLNINFQATYKIYKKKLLIERSEEMNEKIEFYQHPHEIQLT